MKIWKSEKLSYIAPRIDAQIRSKGGQSTYGPSHPLTLHDASQTCRFVKELTHSHAPLDHKHAIGFANQLAYFVFHDA